MSAIGFTLQIDLHRTDVFQHPAIRSRWMKPSLRILRWDPPEVYQLAAACPWKVTKGLKRTHSSLPSIICSKGYVKLRECLSLSWLFYWTLWPLWSITMIIENLRLPPKRPPVDPTSCPHKNTNSMMLQGGRPSTTSGAIAVGFRTQSIVWLGGDMGWNRNLLRVLAFLGVLTLVAVTVIRETHHSSEYTNLHWAFLNTDRCSCKKLKSKHGTCNHHENVTCPFCCLWWSSWIKIGIRRGAGKNCRNRHWIMHIISQHSVFGTKCSCRASTFSIGVKCRL